MSTTDASEHAPSPTEPSLSQPILLCAAAILAVAAWLRVYRLGTLPGLNADEAWYGANALALLRHQPFPLHTPTGNLINPFYFLPLVAAHALLAPSAALVRITSPLWGLLALLLNWLLCRRVLGRATALCTTLLLAALPEDLAQSRLGWDPCQSLLIDAITFYLALLWCRPGPRAPQALLLCLAALSAAVMVHPTNIFLLVVVALAMLLRLGGKARPWLDPRAPGRRWVLTYASLTVFALELLVWKWDWVVLGLGLFLRTENLTLFPTLYARLFWGMTVLRYVAGSLEPGVTSGWLILGPTVLVWALFLPVLWFALRMLHPGAAVDPRDRLVFVGWLVLLLAFLVVGGSLALIRGNERYGIVLLVPGVVAVVRAAEIVLGHRRGLLPWACVGASAALLALFYVDYIQYIERTGGTSHDAFRAADPEPKLAAWQMIDRDRRQRRIGDGGVILTGSWWSYQPVRYFAADSGVRVVLDEDDAQPIDPATQAEIAAAARTGRLWTVEFVGSPRLDALRRLLAAAHVTVEELPVLDFAGRPLLIVGRVLGGR